MRIFKNKWFVDFADKERIADTTLRAAALSAEQGLIDADYGGGVIKQRIPRRNEGKSGGYRAIILFRQGEKAFFVYAFAKSRTANISDLEARKFKELAKVTFALSTNELAKLIETEVYTEIICNEQNENLQE